MPVIRLLPETANKAWRALIETGEPVHRIPPITERRYVISHSQLARLQQLHLGYEILDEWKEMSIASCLVELHVYQVNYGF
jgi:hypothetical protein